MEIHVESCPGISTIPSRGSRRVMGRVLRQLTQFAFAAIFLLPGAWGATIYNYEAYGNSLDGPPGGTPSGPCSSETFVSVLLSVSNCSSAAGVVTSADSLATYTALHADSSLTLTNAILPAGIMASGYARTVDSLNAQVLSSLRSAGVAYLGFTFAVDGMLVDSGLTNALMTVNFGFAYDSGFAGQPADGCSRSISSGSQTVTFSCSSLLYPLSLFEQNTYWFSMSAQEHLAPSSLSKSGSASANFFSTDTITSVQPYDANFKFVPNAAVSSVGNNGTPFVNAPASLPEPSTFSLFAAGLAVAALGRLNRRRAARFPGRS